MSIETVTRTPRHMPYARYAYVLIAAVLLLLPMFSDSYTQYLAIRTLILSIFALGFNILFGYTGLLSFGQAGFFAMGAYTCAGILLRQQSLLMGVLGGTAAAAALAVVFGVLSVRHSRIYFTMLTLAFGMMIYSLFMKWRDATGGGDGLVGIPRAPMAIPGLFSINMNAITHYYYFVAVIAVLALFMMVRLVRSPFGLSLQAIRDSESRAAFAGIPVRKHRLIVFVIAGAYGGLAGSLLPALQSTITPAIAHWEYGAEPVLASLLGGVHNVFGPVVGAVLFVLISDLAARLTEHHQFFMGVVVVVLVLGFQGGVVGLITHTLPRLFGRRGRGGEAR